MADKRTPRKLNGMSAEDMIDTVIDGYIDRVLVEELFDKTDATDDELALLSEVALILFIHPEFTALALAARRAERGQDLTLVDPVETYRSNAHLN